MVGDKLELPKGEPGPQGSVSYCYGEVSSCVGAVGPQGPDGLPLSAEKTRAIMEEVEQLRPPQPKDGIFKRLFKWIKK